MTCTNVWDYLRVYFPEFGRQVALHCTYLAYKLPDASYFKNNWNMNALLDRIHY